MLASLLNIHDARLFLPIRTILHTNNNSQAIISIKSKTRNGLTLFGEFFPVIVNHIIYISYCTHTTESIQRKQLRIITVVRIFCNMLMLQCLISVNYEIGLTLFGLCN